MMKMLKGMFIEFESEHPIFFIDGWKVFDFKLEDYPILIETDGDFWHGNPDADTTKKRYHILKAKKNDMMKNWIARRNGLVLLRFWEKEVFEKPDLVKDEILAAVHKSSTA